MRTNKENIQQNMQIQNEIKIFSPTSNYNSLLVSFGSQSHMETVSQKAQLDAPSNPLRWQ